MASKINVSTCLWFESRAEEAANFYVTLFDDAKITDVVRTSGDSVMTVTLRLNGHEVMLLNGGPHFKLTEAASIMATCDSDADVDRLWTKLTADGGKPTQCNWLIDKFGVTWQIVPAEFLRMVMDSDKAKSRRVFDAMMNMVKLDMPALRRAFDGNVPNN